MQAGVSPVGPAAPADGADDPSAALPRVDIDSLELVRPRSVGVEHVALWAMRQLRPPSLLEELGLSGAQRAAVLGSLVGCMAAPASERAADLFDLQPTVTLHDRTSTCCEGAADRQPLARRGHSKEKRHDCPPLTLGLVLDASGFARRSRVLAGNVAEGGTLQAMPTALDAPPEAAVVLDRGLATEGNVAWLRERRRSGRWRGRPARASRRLCGRCTRACRARAQPGAWRRSGSASDGCRPLSSAAPHCAIDVQADDRGRNATAVAWKRQPLEGSGATHPGVHGLRASSVGWDAERLWRTCVTRTDLEAVLRSLGSALGPRPIHHRRPARSAGHLCLSVLACQLVPVVRQRLRAGRRPAGRRCAVAWRASRG